MVRHDHMVRYYHRVLCGRCTNSLLPSTQMWTSESKEYYILVLTDHCIYVVWADVVNVVDHLNGTDTLLCVLYAPIIVNPATSQSIALTVC